MNRPLVKVTGGDREAPRVSSRRAVARVQRWARAIPAGSLAMACLSWLVVIWLWEAAIFTLAVDDTYYYVKTAIHIADGHGPTFDRLNPTNGFHPLWMIALVPLAAWLGSDVDLLVRVVLSLQIGLVAWGGALVARTLGPAGRWFVQLLALALLNFYVAKVLINGQESALQWFLLALCGFVVAAPALRRIERRRPRLHAVFRGAAAGLLVLARLNAIFFAVPLLVQPLLSARRRKDPSQIRFCALLSLVIFAAVVTPYFAWNVLTTGYALPVSGAVKESFVPSFPLALRLAGVALGMASVAILVVRFRRRRATGSAFIVFPLAIYVSLQFAYDFGSRGRLVPEIWYLVPHAMLALIVGAQLVQRFSSGSRPAKKALLALLTAHCLTALVLWRLRVEPASYSRYVVARDVAIWLRGHTSPNAVLAGWDSGIVGAFTPQRLMNLDGLVNSYDFKVEYLDRGRVEHFIRDVYRVDYLAQYVPRDQFVRSTTYRGVDLAEWHVAYQVCFPSGRS